ncbi:MAG: hypothetical protein ACI4I4_04235 [Acutalibacteraceae bacterium]
MTEQKRIENNRSFIKRCIGRLINYIKTELPEKGTFTTHILCYDEPVSKNEMRMAIMPDSLDVESSRRLKLAVAVGDSGYQV